MAYKITQDCTSCGSCEPECPNSAISEGSDVYVINAESCTECVGFNAAPACTSVCPVEAPQPDPDKVETEGALLERAKKLHPGKVFAADYPSRFKK